MKKLLIYLALSILFSCSTVSTKIVYQTNQLKSKAIDNKTMADLFLQNKDYVKAIDYYNGTLKYYRLSDNISGIIRTLTDIGNAYNIKGDFDTAFDFFNEAMKISDFENTNGIEMGFLFHCIGDNYYFKKQYSPAIENYKKSIEKYNLFDENIATVKISMSKALRESGDLQKAEILLFDALSSLEKLYKSNKLLKIDNLSGAYFSIGFFYFQQKNYLKSKEYITKANEIDKLSESSKGLALNYYSLGRITELTEQDLKKSLYYYEKSRDIYKALNFYDDFITVSEKIALLYEKLSDISMTLTNYLYIFNVTEDSNLKKKILYQVSKIVNDLDTNEKDKLLKLLNGFGL